MIIINDFSTRSSFKISFKCYNNINSLIAPHKFELIEDEIVNDNNNNDFDLILALDNYTYQLIDYNKVNINLLDLWNGFMDCQTLKALNISNGDARCICRDDLYSDVMHSCTSYTTNITGKKYIIPRTSRFSMNVSYVIFCDNCGFEYFGKCGCGKNYNRTFRKRTREHITDIIKVYNELKQKGFYNNVGSIIKNNVSFSIILKSIEKNYTSDVGHFLGLDGSDCYKSNNGNPALHYRSVVIYKLDELDRFMAEAKLCKDEIFLQTSNLSITHGMNDTKDSINFGTFSRDFAKEITSELIDEFESQKENFIIKRDKKLLKIHNSEFNKIKNQLKSLNSIHFNNNNNNINNLPNFTNISIINTDNIVVNDEKTDLIPIPQDEHFDPFNINENLVMNNLTNSSELLNNIIENDCSYLDLSNINISSYNQNELSPNASFKERFDNFINGYIFNSKPYKLDPNCKPF